MHEMSPRYTVMLPKLDVVSMNKFFFILCCDTRLTQLLLRLILKMIHVLEQTCNGFS